MGNCNFCQRPLANNKQIAFRCKECGAVFCSNGNCSGLYGAGRSNGYCKACKTNNSVKPD